MHMTVQKHILVTHGQTHTHTHKNKYVTLTHTPKTKMLNFFLLYP